MILFFTTAPFFIFTPRKMILFSTVPSISHPFAIRELDTHEEEEYFTGASCLIFVYTAQSLVNEGCSIYGQVDHSILSYNVQVGHGTTIKNSVIMPDVIIGNNVEIHRAIIAPYTIIEDGAVIGSENEQDDITLIGDNQRISFQLKEVL